MGDNFRQLITSLEINDKEPVIADKFYLRIGTVDFSIKDFNDQTFSEIMHPDYRLIDLQLRSKKYFINKTLSIMIHCKEDSLFIINFSEFPGCCGKLLAHNFVLREKYVRAKAIYTGNSSEWGDRITLNDTSFEKMTPVILNLIKFIAKYLKYSSVSMILSQENPGLFEEMKKNPEITLVNSFKNARNNHEIDEYIINI